MGRRRNPTVLGQDLESLGLKALGLGATEFVNSKFLSGLARNLIPGNGVMGKLVDAGTTLVSSIIVGKGVGMINSRWGREMQEGGAIYAGAKGVSVVLPGYSVNVSVPSAFPGMRPPAPALPPATTVPADARLAGQRSMGF